MNRRKKNNEMPRKCATMNHRPASFLLSGISCTEGGGLYEGDKALHPVEGGEVSPSAFGTTYTPAPSGLSIHHWPSEELRYM